MGHGVTLNMIGVSHLLSVRGRLPTLRMSGFFTTPQKNLANRAINIVRGKVLGGSSAVNLMGVFLAGAVEYDRKALDFSASCGSG